MSPVLLYNRACENGCENPLFLRSTSDFVLPGTVGTPEKRTILYILAMASHVTMLQLYTGRVEKIERGARLHARYVSVCRAQKAPS